MAVTLKETEGQPSAWPTVAPYPMATEWSELEGDNNPVVSGEVVWRMVERWITTRWRSRSVVYVVEGPGEWESRLTPFSASVTERWTGSAWMNESFTPSPLGGFDLGNGTYRITGTVGDASGVPEDVEEAHRRLHSFMLGNASEHLDNVAIYNDESGGERPRAHAAQALRLSGAADLLRRYRRLA